MTPRNAPASSRSPKLPVVCMLISRSVPVHHNPAACPRIPLQELLARLLRRRARECTISSSTRTSPPTRLRDHRTHRIHVEIQRPEQRPVRVALQIRHMIAARERRDTPGRPSDAGTTQALPAGRTSRRNCPSAARKNPASAPAGSRFSNGFAIDRLITGDPVRDESLGTPSRNPSASTPRIRTAASPSDPAAGLPAAATRSSGV